MGLCMTMMTAAVTVMQIVMASRQSKDQGTVAQHLQCGVGALAARRAGGIQDTQTTLTGRDTHDPPAAMIAQRFLGSVAMILHPHASKRAGSAAGVGRRLASIDAVRTHSSACAHASVSSQRSQGRGVPAAAGASPNSSTPSSASMAAV